ncbi:phosphoglucomutase [Lactobacillus delbrueckii]|uniref:phospho-sugar mutase n=1 Tax=Lactobacillus delbrueckii TaxID=1584 RepID=UPI001F1641CA|nr:phospho-sugar mutase [Lactobacillus delbrueckii]GHN23887.1 phosphoglucomutase [Lactobacillus delbrueckii]GHN25701.1 phosphoglucomutase [Lactobacillus delbrueckii]GHN28192.1 phosphoglucomutase [Lactobacillus delbrueckii]
MLKENIKNEYSRWSKLAIADPDLSVELNSMNEEQIEDAFYRDLEFGTGGLRGTIGAGTNRMNVYTVARASQGLSNYLNKKYDNPSVAIGYDSRIKSDLFAKVASTVFVLNGIQVNIWPQLSPVPTVSFSTRYLHTSAGIMITASHNPSKYNGYKVYGDDGCQITTETAAEILKEIEAIDYFDVKMGDFNADLEAGKVKYISDEVLTAFIEEVKKQSVVTEDINRDMAIVYTPLNGTGRIPMTRALKEAGFTNITLVKEQEMPDGNFPTCPFPNPEYREAMQLGLDTCKKVGADILLATDPDADRCGVGVKTKDGDYRLLTGNEIGLLLFDFICSQRIKHGTMPKNPVMVKTIVTSDMGNQIANHYGVKTIDVLTGFKFIGEQIGLLEKAGRLDDYIFGFEESYGTLSSTYVRDKDAIGGAFMVCEMFAYYKTQGISLLEKLEDLYKQYGYRLNTLHSYVFEGSAGFEKMQEIMKHFHQGIDEFGGRKVVKTLDYSQGLDGLPKSDVLKYLLEGESSVVVRPSGTEPKLKAYVSIVSDTMEESEATEKKVADQLAEYMK